MRQAILREPVPELRLPLPRGSLSGRVLSGGEPVAGLEVRLSDFHDGSLAARVRTRGDGGFHVPHLPAGVYALRLGELTVSFLRVERDRPLDAGTFELLAGGF